MGAAPMTGHARCDIAVIGAGVIGLTVALRLAQDGHEVVLLDPDVPGSGASYGNAGTIADYAVMPVGTPEVLRNLPSLLFNRNSPLSIRRGALASLAPWLLRFAVQSLPAAAARNAAAIAALLALARPAWEDLAADIGAPESLQRRGCLYLYETRAAYRAAAAEMARRRALGIAVDMISPSEIAAMEPMLPPLDGGAAFFPQAVFLDDPGKMMLMLTGAVQAAGVRHLPRAADAVQRVVDGVTILAQGTRLHARRVIVAAGAHSRGLARQAGDRVPLDTERGYHVEWDMRLPLLSRPACPAARGFYLCPMSGRLRAAGTVELGGLAAPASPHRIAQLIKGARDMFPQLGEPDRDWMGFRPSMPDSLPVIGPSRAGAEVIHAFGHGHIGLTLAPVTARIVADLVAGRMPEVDLAPCLPSRF